MHTREHTIDKLNSFLRGEIAAVETYRQALDRLKDEHARERLASCQQSHRARVDLLRQRIYNLGGEPAESSGAWGAFVKLLEGGAAAFGDKAAVAVLEEGEDHGLRDYRDDLDKLDAETRQFVELELLPAQRRTHDQLSALKRALA